MKSRNDFISDGIRIFAVIALLTAVAGPSVADDELEKAKNIIAAQIRDQGYKCDKASGAVRDAEASKPDEAVWLLTCEDASYRVRLVPDMAARVERLSSKKTQP